MLIAFHVNKSSQILTYLKLSQKCKYSKLKRKRIFLKSLKNYYRLIFKFFFSFNKVSQGLNLIKKILKFTYLFIAYYVCIKLHLWKLFPYNTQIYIISFWWSCSYISLSGIRIRRRHRRREEFNKIYSYDTNCGTDIIVFHRTQRWVRAFNLQAVFRECVSEFNLFLLPYRISDTDSALLYEWNSMFRRM